MVNITKKTLEQELALLGDSNIKLVYTDRKYEVYDKSRVIFTGSAKETYIYIMGLKYGRKVPPSKIIDKSEKDEFTAIDYLKGEEGKNIIIEAKKIAQDPYFSQFKNKYVVNIEKITPNSLYFTAVASIISPSGIQSGSSLHIPMRGIKINKEDSLDKIGETILKSIDMVILEKAKRDKNLHSDRLLWITKDTMWYLGWGNEGILTKKVDISVC